ncbi:glyoxalase superfamily protein [Micromonospora zamorensis]|uniref:glyoxalase superfamily protein n=1 Tax=Micromonospora zamorensis TaxID=709883 RepID=UPI0037B2BA83
MDEKITPILHTADAEASAAWYARLGFAKQWEHRFEPSFPLFVCVSGGPMQLYLSEHRDDARPDTLLYLHVGDVEAVAAEFGQRQMSEPDHRRLQSSRQCRASGRSRPAQRSSGLGLHRPLAVDGPHRPRCRPALKCRSCRRQERSPSPR